MIELGRITAILLCAGLSRRFGSDDKLLHPLAGRPLVDHAAATIASLGFGRRIAVVPDGRPELRRLLEQRGLSIVANPRPRDGQDQSLRLGIAAAMKGDPDAIIVCLGDMPYVPPAHFRALADAADEHRPVASAGENWHSPPVLFPKRFLASLLEVPPRELLGRAPGPMLVQAPAGALADFDTPSDFKRTEPAATRSV